MPHNAAEGLCPACLLAAASLPTEAGPTTRRRQTSVPDMEQVSAAFPQWEMVECIGAGGMGAVFKARQPKLDRWVALKLLPEALAEDPEFTERFEREARTLARLGHPGIVTVHDFGKAGGFHYLVMEYVDGVNLRQAMRTGRFTPAQALGMVPRICEALQYAHDAGVTHRDIKPENILLDARGRVKIADFGIAKLLGEPDVEGTLTATGSALGTPQYMAPEQIEHPSEVDHRADIYSLGVVFYELLTGELPLGRFAPPSEKVDLDARVDAIVLRALAKERELRQQTAGEMQTEVERVTTARRQSVGGDASHLAAPPPAGRPWNLPLPWKWALLIVWGLLLGIESFQQAAAWRWSWQLVVPGLWNPANWTSNGFPIGSWIVYAAALAGVATLGWWAIWSKRAVWLGAFPKRLPDAGAGKANREIDAWLRRAMMATVAFVVASLVWLLLIESIYVPSSPVWVHGGSWHSIGRLLLTTVSLWGILLPLAFLVWRENRRLNVQAAKPIPLRAHRVAVGMLVFAALGALPLLTTHSDGARLVVMGNSSWAALIAVALWTRSRLWRAMALPLNASALAYSIVNLVFLARRTLDGGMGLSAFPDSWPPPFVATHPGALLVLSAAAILGPLAGCLTLLSPGVRPAFGLPPRGHPAADSNPAPTGPSPLAKSPARESQPTPPPHTTTGPSGIPESMKPLVLMGLLALLVLLAPGTLRITLVGMGGLIPVLLGGGIMSPIAAGVLVVSIGLPLAAWSYRERLLEPFDLQIRRGADGGEAPMAAVDRWLRGAMLGVMASLVIWMATYVPLGLGLAVHLDNARSPGSRLSLAWWTAVLMSVGLSVLLAWKRGYRRAAGPGPRWMRRFGIELAVAGLVCIVAEKGLLHESPYAQVSSNTAVFLFLPATALLTRSPYWRAVALPVGLVLVSMHLIFLGWIGLQDDAARLLPTTLQSALAWIAILLQLAGTVALVLPSAQAAFGIPRPSRAPRSPHLPHPAGAA
ncbi:MAG: serine/threonine protein kinase [Verrucomicrobiae bacterium]|nr:serine/threonine protein kinase [Verrucomicrobiae bacterium]